MFGAFGGALHAGSITFMGQAAVDGGVAGPPGLHQRVLPLAQRCLLF